MHVKYLCKCWCFQNLISLSVKSAELYCPQTAFGTIFQPIGKIIKFPLYIMFEEPEYKTRGCRMNTRNSTAERGGSLSCEGGYGGAKNLSWVLPVSPPPVFSRDSCDTLYVITCVTPQSSCCLPPPTSSPAPFCGTLASLPLPHPQAHL